MIIVVLAIVYDELMPLPSSSSSCFRECRHGKENEEGEVTSFFLKVNRRTHFRRSFRPVKTVREEKRSFRRPLTRLSIIELRQFIHAVWMNSSSVKEYGRRVSNNYYI